MGIHGDAIVDLMRAQTPAGLTLELPPKVFLDMGGEMLEYVEGESLTTRFPVLERYQNPLGYMQGGMLAAALDNTLGPLSYLVAPPSVTTQLNVSYIRPVTPQEKFIVVVARVTEKTKKQLFLTGEVRNEAGKIMALATTSCLVID